MNIFKALFVVITFLLLPIVWGWCMANMFNWFIAPLGVPTITIIHGIGLALFASMLKIGLSVDEMKSVKTLDNKDIKDIRGTIRHLALSLAAVITMGAGYLVHLYM